MNIKLDERLGICADFVRENAVLADIGTDHAYLPAFLINSGKIKSAIACDINKKPLESAMHTIKENDIENNVSLRLCDGLDGVDDNEFTDLVIAGMGGELIVKILSNCRYIKNKKYRIILQPMTKPYELRKYLCESGFLILDETAAVSNNKIYTVICAEFCGKPKSYPEKFYYFGKLLNKQDEKSLAYCEKIKRSLIKKAEGLSKSKGNESCVKELLDIVSEIK